MIMVLLAAIVAAGVVIGLAVCAARAREQQLSARERLDQDDNELERGRFW